MRRFLLSLTAGLGRVFTTRIRLPRPTSHQTMAGLSLLGLAGLSYMLGAGVMYFRLPSSPFFDQAFAGAKAWHERGRPTAAAPQGGGVAEEGVSRDRPE